MEDASKTAFSAQVKLTAIISMLIVFTGVSYSRNNVWQDPLSLWTDTAAKSPNRARPNHELGLAMAARGYEADSLYYLTRSKQLDPGLFDSALSKAESYRRQGLLDETIKEYEKILKNDPADYKTLNNLGVAFNDKKRYPEAFQAITRAIEINPEFAVAYSNLGQLYFEMGFAKEAIEHYGEAIRLDPNDPEPYVKRGYAYEKLGMPEQAVAEYQKALSIDPQNGTAKMNLNRLPVSHQAR
jgi:tetratricopeptide (TPR) repeat protein